MLRAVARLSRCPQAQWRPALGLRAASSLSFKKKKTSDVPPEDKIKPPPALASCTPMEMINSIPPIEVEGTVAKCDGGRGALGHPVEYIQLNKVRLGQPETCKYCGLRFVMKQHH